MPIPRDQPSVLDLAIPAEEISIVAAASSDDPVFGSVTPDDYSAYVQIRFGHCLPVVLGPESVSGAVFGLHPATVARGYQTAIHKQMNRDHKMKYLGAKQDAIVGCILAVAFPQEPEGGWTIGSQPAEAPHIRAQAVLHKQADGVDRMLGDHLSGKRKMSVSMEMSFYNRDTGIWDRHSGQVYDRREIPQNLKGYLFEDDKGRLLVRKGSRAGSLVPVTGGKSGMLWFSGVGYTPNPAEPTAAIDSIAASASERDGLLVCSSAAVLDWMPGMHASWPGGWGRGKVVAVHYEGVHTAHGQRMTAKEDDPLLCLELPDRVRVLRKAASVARKI